MSNEKSRYGISLSGLTFLIFLTLKLTGVGIVADWSWWWVTAPLWIFFIAVVVLLIIVILIAYIIDR